MHREWNSINSSCENVSLIFKEVTSCALNYSRLLCDIADVESWAGVGYSHIRPVWVRATVKHSPFFGLDRPKRPRFLAWPLRKTLFSLTTMFLCISGPKIALFSARSRSESLPFPFSDRGRSLSRPFINPPRRIYTTFIYTTFIYTTFIWVLSPPGVGYRSYINSSVISSRFSDMTKCSRKCSFDLFIHKILRYIFFGWFII